MRMLNTAVVDADEQSCRKICALLEQANIPVAPLYSLQDLPGRLRSEPVAVLIVDLDTLPVDNNFFRSLKKQYPNLHILCLSSRTYHPGLEEAMGSHICASLAKPLNSEELFFWMKSIAEMQPAEAQAVPSRKTKRKKETDHE
jgi:DNA-binding NtrC family response regulator